MATQAAKVKDEESQGNALSEAAAGAKDKITGSLSSSREFMHDVRVEMKAVTWPTRDDVMSTTAVVIVTVAFFGVFLFFVDKFVQLGVSWIFKKFGL